jgi:hypothetical protein
VLRAFPFTQAKLSFQIRHAHAPALWKTKTDNASLYNLNVMSQMTLDATPDLSSVFWL